MGRAHNKSAAIRAVLRSAANPLTMEQLQPRVERKLGQVFGPARMYRLLGVMQTAGELIAAGWGSSRTYAMAGKSKK